MTSPPPVLARVVRDGVVESVHRGALVVADAGGRVLAALGDPQRRVYTRSAVKPFQALGTLALLDRAGMGLDTTGLAIACASHEGSDTHQIEAARLLALAGLDESALQCPPALPGDLPTLLEQRVPDPLAHNCSGKHAAFLLATVAVGQDPARYLEPDAPIQRRAREALTAVTGAEPEGPGVDGCGAPTWLLPLGALAVGFARLAAGSHGLERVRLALRRHPDLVGGTAANDTRLMRADPRVVAKRGAEALLAAGMTVAGPPAGAAGADVEAAERAGRGTFGVVVKVEDGGSRAAGPVVAAVLEALGAAVPASVRRPAVLGGGRPHGSIDVDPAVLALPLTTVYQAANDS